MVHLPRPVVQLPRPVVLALFPLLQFADHLACTPPQPLSETLSLSLGLSLSLSLSLSHQVETNLATS